MSKQISTSSSWENDSKYIKIKTHIGFVRLELLKSLSLCTSTMWLNILSKHSNTTV